MSETQGTEQPQGAAEARNPLEQHQAGLETAQSLHQGSEGDPNGPARVLQQDELAPDQDRSDNQDSLSKSREALPPQATQAGVSPAAPDDGSVFGGGARDHGVQDVHDEIRKSDSSLGAESTGTLGHTLASREGHPSAIHEFREKVADKFREVFGIEEKPEGADQKPEGLDDLEADPKVDEDAEQASQEQEKEGSDNGSN